MNAVISAAIRFRAAIGILLTLGIGLSVFAIRQAPLDAIPDVSDPQIVIYAKWPRSPQLLEAKVTEPLIQALIGSPGIQSMRATSHMGYSFVYVILNDAKQRATVQQRVLDKINSIRAQLPGDASITLGPNASSVGWIYQYALVDHEATHDLRDLRALNQSTVKLTLQTVPGVAEVATVGGLEKQYQLKIFPPLLAQSGLTLRDVINALQSAFQETGGRTIDVTNREYQVSGSIGSGSVDDLESIVVGRNRDLQAIRLKDLGYVQVGYDLRRGIADLDGKGEVVGGIVIMEHGQNVLAVTRAVEEKLQSIAANLPQGVEVVNTYNRSSLIKQTLRSFVETLLYELLVVVVVVAVFLRNIRTALAPVCILLLATLFTVLPLAAFGQTINLLSLAGLAIAIGEMVDATIVIIENCTAELAAHPQASAVERSEIVVRSIATVTRPLLFSLLIILTSFVPVFFLGEREARLFDPLAFSKTAAMTFSTLLTLFLLPLLAVWIFRKWNAPVRSESVLGVRIYRAVLRSAIRFRYGVLVISVAMLIPAIWLLGNFHKDYMPEMEEGSVLYMPTTLPGVPVREAGWVLQEMDKRIKTFPEVERVFGKLGRADTSTDPAPVTMIETTVLLHPHSKWRPDMTKDKLIAEMNAALQVVGYVNTWTQPIATRMMMQDTGIQTAVGLKIKGADLAVIQQLSQQVERALRGVPGTTTVIAERIADGYFVDTQYDPSKMAEHSVTADEAMDTVRYAIGGDNVVSITQLDRSVVPLGLQYSPEYIDTLEKIRNAAVITRDGRSVPMKEIANVAVRKMPEMIRNDNGKLAGYVYVYLSDSTASDYVGKAQRTLAEQVSLPAGYEVEWTGLYRYTEQAQARLKYIVPLTLVIIFALLLMAFKSFADSALIMLSVPFALVGGVFLQALLRYSTTTAVVVGYIALFAIAIQTGIIMIVFIRQALAARTGTQSYVDAVIDGSVLRLRPKLMTVAATVLSLLPVMFSNGQGMELMKPIATPTIGGMLSSTLYVLILIPCLFAIGDDWQRWRVSRKRGA
jgi:Cu(I)/Ag(I) efflux system membrane protein CusA/SilA